LRERSEQAKKIKHELDDAPGARFAHLVARATQGSMCSFGRADLEAGDFRVLPICGAIRRLLPHLHQIELEPTQRARELRPQPGSLAVSGTAVDQIAAGRPHRALMQGGKKSRISRQPASRPIPHNISASIIPNASQKRPAG